MKKYYVYILKCKDNSYYVGITNDIERRVFEHNEGIIKGYTTTRRPVELVFFEEFDDVNEAIEFEKKIKGWRRAKKEALITKNEKLLPELSKTYSLHPSTSSG